MTEKSEATAQQRGGLKSNAHGEVPEKDNTRPETLKAQWENAVLRSTLSPTMRAALWPVKHFCGPNGTGCFANAETLAALSGLSLTYWRKNIAAAAVEGWIDVTRQLTSRGWRKHHYALAVPAGADDRWVWIGTRADEDSLSPSVDGDEVSSAPQPDGDEVSTSMVTRVSLHGDKETSDRIDLDIDSDKKEREIEHPVLSVEEKGSADANSSCRETCLAALAAELNIPLDLVQDIFAEFLGLSALDETEEQVLAKYRNFVRTTPRGWWQE